MRRIVRGLARFYKAFEDVLLWMHPLLQRIGYQRLERRVAAVERNVKGLLFDCRMCGRCVLSSTGMSCPMNCPKQLRNGPCGGSLNGECEVPGKPCVWTEAYRRLKPYGEALTMLERAPVLQEHVGEDPHLAQVGDPVERVYRVVLVGH